MFFFENISQFFFVFTISLLAFFSFALHSFIEFFKSFIQKFHWWAACKNKPFKTHTVWLNCFQTTTAERKKLLHSVIDHRLNHHQPNNQINLKQLVALVILCLVCVCVYFSVLETSANSKSSVNFFFFEKNAPKNHFPEFDSGKCKLTLTFRTFFLPRFIIIIINGNDFCFFFDPKFPFLFCFFCVSRTFHLKNKKKVSANNLYSVFVEKKFIIIINILFLAFFCWKNEKKFSSIIFGLSNERKKSKHFPKKTSLLNLQCQTNKRIPKTKQEYSFCFHHHHNGTFGEFVKEFHFFFVLT